MKLKYFCLAANWSCLLVKASPSLIDNEFDQFFEKELSQYQNLKNEGSQLVSPKANQIQPGASQFDHLKISPEKVEPKSQPEDQNVKTATGSMEDMKVFGPWGNTNFGGYKILKREKMKPPRLGANNKAENLNDEFLLAAEKYLDELAEDSNFSPEANFGENHGPKTHDNGLKFDQNLGNSNPNYLDLDSEFRSNLDSWENKVLPMMSQNRQRQNLPGMTRQFKRSWSGNKFVSNLQTSFNQFLKNLNLLPRSEPRQNGNYRRPAPVVSEEHKKEIESNLDKNSDDNQDQKRSLLEANDVEKSGELDKNLGHTSDKAHNLNYVESAEHHAQHSNNQNSDIHHQNLVDDFLFEEFLNHLEEENLADIQTVMGKDEESHANMLDSVAPVGHLPGTFVSGKNLRKRSGIVKRGWPWPKEMLDDYCGPKDMKALEEGLAAAKPFSEPKYVSYADISPEDKAWKMKNYAGTMFVPYN